MGFFILIGIVVNIVVCKLGFNWYRNVSPQMELLTFWYYDCISKTIFASISLQREFF